MRDQALSFSPVLGSFHKQGLVPTLCSVLVLMELATQYKDDQNKPQFRQQRGLR